MATVNVRQLVNIVYLTVVVKVLRLLRLQNVMVKLYVSHPSKVKDLMIVTNAGVIIRIGVEDISQNGRAAQGVRLIKLNDDQFVSTVAKVDEEKRS